VPARRFGAALVLVLLTVVAPAAVLAATPGISGHVASADGAPIAHAVVELEGNGPLRRAYSDASGDFSLDAPAGTYTISIFARGYDGVSGRTITIPDGRLSDVRFDLPRGQVASLMTVAQVHSNGTALLSSAPAPSVSVNAQTYAAQGVERTSDILTSELSTTVYPVIGGGLNAPAVVALRGPDPSETLVDVDGHQVNNGSTGDYDLSLLDPSDLQHVEVVYGIAPSALYGPNTLGGALNVVTLQPTTQSHVLERLSFGTFGSDSGTLAATGTDDRLGYALSIHRTTSSGQLANAPFGNTSSDSGTSLGTSPIGNDMSATSSLANLKYLFGNGGFAGFSFHNQTVYRDLSATLSSSCAPGECTVEGSTPDSLVPNPTTVYSNFSGSSISSNNDAYGVDLQLPLGAQTNGVAATTATYRHESSVVTQDVTGAAAGSSPYLYNDRDRISDDTLEFDRPLPKGSVAIKFALTQEHLLTDNVLGVIFADGAARNPVAASASRYGALALLPADSVSTNGSEATMPTLTQTQRWVGLSYAFDPSAKLHYSAAAYYSDYSSFGHSFDPRIGIVWTPTAATSVRGSIGNTFQSPQLPTFIVPSANAPIPVVDGYASIGNLNATAERATSMDVGAEHVVHLGAHDLHVALDLYRTNLHNGVATFFGPAPCTTATVTLASNPSCLSYPVNVTHEVYQGAELRTDYQLAPKTLVHVNYDVDSVYTVSFPSAAADDVIPYVQSLGVPLHKLAVSFEHQPNTGLSYYAGFLYEGTYNELNLAPYATVRAGVTWHLPRVDIALVGENLTDAYDFLTTRTGGGVPYQQTTGLVPTDAIPLPGRRFTIIFTHRT